jgi:3-polyprenyl-4-hydroxybenzoate decarboxylase
LKRKNGGLVDRRGAWTTSQRNNQPLCCPSEGFTRPWPDEIKMAPEVKKKIDALWEELGLGSGG